MQVLRHEPDNATQDYGLNLIFIVKSVAMSSHIRSCPERVRASRTIGFFRILTKRLGCSHEH